MKTLVLFLLTIFSISVSGQTIWVADNNFNAPTGPNVFSSIQACVNVASPGDIIQVQPSPTTYGNATIEIENLTLMGIGFNVDKEIPLTSRMGNITLRNNIDNTTDADGTIIKGLQFGTITLAVESGGNFLLENILIKNCQFANLYNGPGSADSPVDGLEVRDCYITNTSSSANLFYKSLNNAIFRNNLVLGGFNFAAATSGNNIVTNNILYGTIYTEAEGGTTILNNNFIGATGVDFAFTLKMKNCSVNNNIFYGVTPSIAAGGTTSSNFEFNSFSNNLVYATGDDTMPPTGGLGNDGSGNIITSPDFVNVPLLNTWSSGYDFTLQGGSPALGAGSDGTDIGISGGVTYAWPDANFVLKTTAAPVIQILNTSTVINPGDDLPVRIKANSN